MCSRYENASSPESIIERFGLMPSTMDGFDSIRCDLADGPIGSEIRPTDPALVIGFDQAIDVLRWGLDVPWQKQPVINARAETAQIKTTFTPILNRRVVVPASVYFEWRRSGTVKIKTRIGTRDEPVLAMAGLRTDDRYTILTCSPAPAIAHIHNRMPVLLDHDGVKEWLNPDHNFADLTGLLHPYSGEFNTEEVPTGKNRQTDLFD